MKPSEIVRLFAFHPKYNPAGVQVGDTISYHGTRYLCNVSEHVMPEDLPSFEDLSEFRFRVEEKLKSLHASVLANHFHYNLGIRQTLENSRDFWVLFAEELEAKEL